MKLWHSGITGLVLVCLAGCSAVGLGDKRIDYRNGATQVPALELPPDLTAPGNEERFKVSESGDSVATYSSYSKKNLATNAQNSAILPVAQGVRLERDGAQRWLVVNDKPENVWPVVKSFWQGVGLSIKTEDQAAGIMETDWSENRAKIPDGLIHDLIGKVFSDLYSSGERDQYRVRLERGKDGKSTEIYITHRGLAEVLSRNGDQTSTKWEPRPNDPELEAEMLQRLMVAFGKSRAEAEQAVADAAAGVPATKSVKTVGLAKLQADASGEKIIMIGDPFDKSWRRVGLAIESAELTIDDKDRTAGLYLLKLDKQESSWLDKLKFWKGSPDPKARYRVNVKDSGESCEVSVTNQDGKNDDTSKQMLEAIFKNINS